MEIQQTEGAFAPAPMRRKNRTEAHMAKMRARRAPLEGASASEMGKRGVAQRRLNRYRSIVWPAGLDVNEIRQLDRNGTSIWTTGRWYRVREICFCLNVTKQTARLYITTGQFGEYVNVGRNVYVVKKQAVRNWVANDIRECRRILGLT